MHRVYQALIDDLAEGHLPLVLSLPDSAHALAFARATEELELMLDGTEAIIVSVAEYVQGEPPPPDSETPGGPWLLAGLIRGPLRKDAPDPEKWFGECREILESHGLQEEREDVQ
jgi:hypothetical protein